MIISRGRRYIFVHIPKTGGTSMAAALEDRAMKDDILIGDTPKAVRRRKRLKALEPSGRLWKHARLADIEGVVSEQEMRDFFVFTLVRNPWDRMVSYYHWLGDQSFKHPAVISAKANSFTAFLNDKAVQPSLLAENYADYLKSPSGENCADALIRLEHLATDIEPLEDHLGFSIEMPHLNQSERSPGYRDAYSDADAELVAKLYAAEIERFGYVF